MRHEHIWAEAAKPDGLCVIMLDEAIHHAVQFRPDGVFDHDGQRIDQPCDHQRARQLRQGTLMRQQAACKEKRQHEDNLRRHNRQRIVHPQSRNGGIRGRKDAHPCCMIRRDQPEKAAALYW